VDGSPAGSGGVAGTFENWDDTFSFALANELTGDRPWLGEIHLVAVYERALIQAEVDQNYNAGPHPSSILPSPDQNGDGDVDGGDLFFFVLAFGTSTGDPGFDAGFDFDRDGAISADDLDNVAGAYGNIL
jgi:hypothetical protein